MIHRCGALALGVALWPAGAAAQEPGVHLDPTSPAGKEYAIPLEDARRTGASEDLRSKGISRNAANTASQLFGAGIRRVQRASSDGSPARPRRGSPTRRPAGNDDKATPYLSAVGSSGPGAPLVAGGSAATVLLLGGTLLALMRRSARSRRR